VIFYNLNKIRILIPIEVPTVNLINSLNLKLINYIHAGPI